MVVSPAIHPSPRCVFLCKCVLITPSPQKQRPSVAQRGKRTPRSLRLFHSSVLRNSACGSSDDLTQHRLLPNRTLVVVPHVPVSPVHKSPPISSLLQGETFPTGGKNHLVVITFYFFPLHFSPSLHSIGKSKNKHRLFTDWKTVELHHADFAIDAGQKAPEVSHERLASPIHSTLHHTQRQQTQACCVLPYGGLL